MSTLTGQEKPASRPVCDTCHTPYIVDATNWVADCDCAGHDERPMVDIGYDCRPGDVLQHRSEHLKARPWLPYEDVTPAKRASAIEAATAGVYRGVRGEWRIVRDGKVVFP